MKRFLFFLIGMMAVVSAFAAPRSQEAARQLAAQYFTAHSSIMRAPASVAAMQHAWTAPQQNGTPAFYVFNRGEDGGFVMISADDRTRTVLGYAESGHFDADKLPANARKWLDGYCREISYAAALPASAERLKASAEAADSASYVPVSPICKTLWGQLDPFNMLCPEKGEEHCVTGCVATAAAQIMAVHKWPAQGTGSHSYLWGRSAGDSVMLSVDFSETTYQWSQMSNTYTASSSQESREAVATLMYHCGVACDMAYGLNEDGGSMAYYYSMIRAFPEYFGYDRGIRILNKDYTGERIFLDSINAELRRGRPVYFSGQVAPEAGGHAFVCDGIDQDGLVHINWGWTGYCDAYYQVSALKPANQSTGEIIETFTSDVTAYMNIRPAAENKPIYTFTSTQIQFEQNRFPRSTKLHYMADTLLNRSAYDWSGNPALLVYKKGALVGMYEQDNYDGSLRSLYCYYQCNAYLSLKSLPVGKYEIVPAMSVADQLDVYEPIYTLGIGEYRCPMEVTSDSIFIGEPGDIEPEDPDDPVTPQIDPLPYDAQNRDFIEDFDSCILRSTAVTDGYGWLTASNDQHANLNVLVILPKGATELTPGTYPVSSDASYQSVYAGGGLTQEGYIKGSYACYRNNAGNATVPLWFVVNGELRVNEYGVAELNATNSYGRTIRCRLGNWMLPVENVQDEREPVRKILRNGQLLIIRGDKTYMLTGQEVR